MASPRRIRRIFLIGTLLIASLGSAGLCVRSIEYDQTIELCSTWHGVAIQLVHGSIGFELLRFDESDQPGFHITTYLLSTGAESELQVITRPDLGAYQTSRGGFGFYLAHESVTVGSDLWCVILPAWIVPALLGFAAMAMTRSSWRNPPGVCRQCGYDLRATPERCPECGTLVSVEGKTRQRL